MEYFEDFDNDEIVENFNSLRKREEDFIEYVDETVQLKHKSKNKFVFESFSTRLKNLKLRLNQNIEKDYNLITLNNEKEKEFQLKQKQKGIKNENLTIEGEDEINLLSSNFKNVLERERSINSKNAEFLILYNKLNQICFSYLYLVNNYKKVFDILKEEIDKRYKEKYIDGLYICFELLIALIKDIREECYDYFVENNLEQIVKLVKVDSNEINDDKKFHLIDNVFTFFVNIFKFFEKSIQNNFKKLFVIYSELLFNNNKYIRLFACQSLCYIIKNLNKDEINDTFTFLFDIMLKPSKLFDAYNKMDIEEKEADKEDITTKDIIYKILNDNNKYDSSTKIVICDSISELLSEVLINIKTISIKSDLILYKFKDISQDKKNNINILIILIHTFIKLIKKVNPKFSLDVLALFHFFIINFYFSQKDVENKDLPNYQKLKSNKLHDQLIKLKNIISIKDTNDINISYTIFSFLIFSKELLLKNFKDNTDTFSDYINDILTIFKDYIFPENQNNENKEYNDINQLQKTFVIEISVLLLKFHSNIHINYPLNELIITNKKLLNYFLDNLIQLNSFAFFQSFSLYSFRSPYSQVDNDDYNLIEYNKDTIEEIFNNIINNENIQYNNLIDIISTDEKLFGEDLGLIIYEENQKNILIKYIFNNSKNYLKKQISNLNEQNYHELKKLIFICKMINNEKTTKYIQENIVQELYNLLIKENKNNDKDNIDELNNIFVNDFYDNSKHYINKKQCLLDMLLYCYKSCNEESIQLIKEFLIKYKNTYINYGIYYSLLNNIIFNDKNNDNNKILFDLNLTYHLVNLLNNKNNFRYYFTIIYKNYLIKKYNKEFKDSEINLINEIFSSIENLFQSNINLTYDKKYSITFEIIVSKLVLIISKEGITKHKLELLSFVLWFILGSYWISLTKSVWPILNKMLNQIFNLLVETINIMTYPEYKKDIVDFIMNPLSDIIKYIQKYPNETDYINKNNDIIKNEYIVMEKNSKNNIGEKYLNIFLDEYKTISTFFTGMPAGLVDSYNIFLSSDEYFRDQFVDKVFVDTCAKFDTEGLLVIKQILNINKNNIEDLNNDYNVLFNYIYDKENKTSFSNTIFKLKESLFGVMSKITNLSKYKNYNNIRNILYNQIILSRSTLIQKYSIDILSIFDTHIKNYNNLLKEIVDSTTVLIKVNNIEKIMSDDNQLITSEDRQYLIPVMTRLYYSKYFNIKNTEFGATTKKMKTKNKINLINYFVQLNTDEFNEYINIIFDSINKELFNEEEYDNIIDYKNKKYIYALLNIRTMKKILEILKINLKQITKLFNDNNIIENISNLIINCFIFMKQLGQKIKHNKDEIYNNCIKYIDNYGTSQIHNYFNNEEFNKFFNFMNKNIKDIKKESLHIFIMIFNQFYNNENMINDLAKRLCDEYKDNLLNKITIKTNSIFKFFLSLSRHAKLHFIFIINDNEILKSLFNSLQSKDIERSFIFNIVDFFENIISPYSIEGLNERGDKMDEEVEKSGEKGQKISKYVEIMDFDEDNDDEDEDSLNYIRDDIPITYEESINNFNKIIVNNLNDINKSLTSLIFNEKISPTIKDNLTLKIIEILLNIWSLYTNTNTTKTPKNYNDIPSVNELFDFLLKIIQNDKKIFGNKEIFDNVLKLMHILILIKINKINGNKKLKEEIENIYNIFIHLIYKIENFNSRLLLAIILKEFAFLDDSKDKKLENVLEFLIKLNKNTTGKRELGKELDNDSIIEIINNELNNKFIENNINYLEVIIYQLLVLSSNANIDDFALNSSALDKLKEIFKYISKKNLHSKFKQVFNTFFNLLNNNFIIYSKILYEIFYIVNSVNANDITGKDIYELPPASDDMEEEKNIDEENIDLSNNKKKKYEDNFFIDIMNFNIDRRIEALKMLEYNLSSNTNKKTKISEYSLINFVIPVIENFLNYKYYVELPITDKKSKKNFVIKHKNDSIKEIIVVTQKILPLIIEYPIKEQISKRILLFLFSNLKRISKNNSNNNFGDELEYSIDIFKMTNESLTIVLNSIIKIYFNTIEYNKKLVKISEEQANELNKEIIENNLENKNETKEQKDNNILNKKNNYILISNMYNNLFKQLNEEILPELNKFQEEIKNNIKEDIDNNIDMDEEENKMQNKGGYIYSLSLYEILTEEIYPSLKSLLYINENREKKNNYYIRNYIIAPYLHIAKLLPPINIKSELNQLIIELINNLSSLDAGVRGKSRDGMKFFLSNLDQIFIIKFFESMKSSLHSGYQRHVFAYTVNYLLQFITNYKICEISLNLIMPILFDELFGDISAEKEIGHLVNKYKEAKENKGLNSMELIGKNISIKYLITDLVTPMKNYLMIRKNSSEMTQKVNEVIIALVKGIKLNCLINKDNEEIINDLLDYGYILIHLGVEKNQQNLKEIKKLKNIEIKGNDIYTVDFKNLDNPYVIEVANRYIEEKNEIIYSNLFAVLGLEFFITLLKNKIFDFSKIEKNSELYEKLNNILETIFSCMKMTNSTVVVSKSIKIIISMITENEKFFVIKKNLTKITKNLFKLILSINSGDIPLTQSVLSAISAILTKFNFINVTDSQIKTLLSFLKLNIFNPEIKPYVFNCFYSLIKKKILHPDIYDMINYMREVYLKSFDENTITLCKKIFFDFINTYPLETKGRLNHLNFYINNCESNTRKCELNSIDMLINFASKQNFEGIKENLDFLIMKMFTLYANSEDSELKTKIEELLLNLYNNYNDNNNNCFKVYYDKALNIIEENSNINNCKEESEQNNNIKVFGIIILSLLLNLNINNIDCNQVIKVLNKSIKEEINNMNTYIENKMNNYDYLLTSNNDNNIQLKENSNQDSNKWNILYQILVCIERLFNNYINNPNTSYKIQKNTRSLYISLFDNIIKALNHPHSFIKVISLRLLINNILNMDFYNITDNQLDIILSQINFILLSNPAKLFFEEKTFNYCRNIITKLISKNSEKNEKTLEFLKNLTNDVKKWISNKGNGLIILKRIIDLFDDIIEKIFYEEKKDDCYYLKPIIELTYRINNNQLAEDIIKQRCGSIMEKINNKMNSNILTKVYKEVTKEINLLKQKRKMEQVDKFRKNNEDKNMNKDDDKMEKIKNKKKNKNKKHQNKNKKNKNLNLEEDDD